MKRQDGLAQKSQNLLRKFDVTNHTPAPWDVDTDGNICHEDCLGSIPVVQGSGDGIAVKSADLDLILAAPDMYEALECAKALLDVRNDRGVIYADIYAALKKARGEV